jgi:2-oxoglutarate ferredoxin oxidoreductase subunit alpha
MSEFLGLAYFAEVPAVLFDVQRAGPSTGMPTRTQQSDLFATAYASHGDTKHVLLFPSTPKECFEMGAQAFDLADRLQTPVILLTDLDLGMNDNVSEPLEWDDSRQYDRGKVFSAEQLDAMTERFGRYVDMDNDGICYRTFPGTHPKKGAFFTRGTSRDEYAVYTEDGDVYVRNMERLLRKFETAKEYVPAPEITPAAETTSEGVLFFGTSADATREALDMLSGEGIHLDAMRIRAFPFSREVEDFIANHERVFVVEQNRDGQLRKLLIIECEIDPKKLALVRHYNGMPITARNISRQIRQLKGGATVTKIRRKVG